MLPSTRGVKQDEEVEELGLHHPRHVWAGGGGLPAVGQDDAHQAREDHGCKRRGTKDTVTLPVKMYTLECGYRSCMFWTGDHIPGNPEDDHRWLIETHFELEHPAPPLIMMEGAVDEGSWEAFARWYVHYRDEILSDEMQDNEDRLFAFLETNLGDVSKLIRDKLGESYTELTELDLMLEVMKITRAQPEQHPKQDQLNRARFTADGVTVMEQQEKISANKVTVMQQKPDPKSEVKVDEQEAMAEEDTVTRGSGTVSVHATENMSEEQTETTVVRMVGAEQGEPAEKPVSATVGPLVAFPKWNTIEDNFVGEGPMTSDEAP